MANREKRYFCCSEDKVCPVIEDGCWASVRER